MTTRTANVSALDLMPGSFGMALIALLGWACEQEPGGWAFDRIAPVGIRMSHGVTRSLNAQRAAQLK